MGSTLHKENSIYVRLSTIASDQATKKLLKAIFVRFSALPRDVPQHFSSRQKQAKHFLCLIVAFCHDAESPGARQAWRKNSEGKTHTETWLGIKKYPNVGRIG
jgi:hypothetical protein